MKKELFLFSFCLLFLTPSIKADEFEKKHGIGVINVQLDSLIALDLWESPDDKVPSHFIVTQKDSTYPTLHHFFFDKLKRDSFPSWFSPLVFHIDIENCRVDFNCLEETPLYYKTNLECEPGKYIWIQKTKNIKFFKWLDFYLSVASVEYTRDTALLYEKASAKSQPYSFITTPTSRRIQIKPIEIKGSWMKVDMFEFEEGSEGKNKKSGWIRWRDDKDPLIKFNLMNC